MVELLLLLLDSSSFPFLLVFLFLVCLKDFLFLFLFSLLSFIGLSGLIWLSITIPSPFSGIWIKLSLSRMCISSVCGLYLWIVPINSPWCPGFFLFIIIGLFLGMRCPEVNSLLNTSSSSSFEFLFSSFWMLFNSSIFSLSWIFLKSDLFPFFPFLVFLIDSLMFLFRAFEVLSYLNLLSLFL